MDFFEDTKSSGMVKTNPSELRYDRFATKSMPFWMLACSSGFRPWATEP